MHRVCVNVCVHIGVCVRGVGVYVEGVFECVGGVCVCPSAQQGVKVCAHGRGGVCV